MLNWQKKNPPKTRTVDGIGYRKEQRFAITLSVRSVLELMAYKVPNQRCHNIIGT